jgi:hypothetical protein
MGLLDQHDVLWDERAQSLTLIGVGNDPTSPTQTKQCAVTKPRSIMAYFDEWVRLGKRHSIHARLSKVG